MYFPVFPKFCTGDLLLSVYEFHENRHRERVFFFLIKSDLRVVPYKMWCFESKERVGGVVSSRNTQFVIFLRYLVKNALVGILSSRNTPFVIFLRHLSSYDLYVFTVEYHKIAVNVAFAK